MQVSCLNHFVQILFFRRQQIEIQLTGGGQGLDDYLQRVPVHSIPQVEEHDTDFCVSHEQRLHAALLQIFARRVIIREVTVVHQGLVQAGERMCAARMPNPPSGGVPLVCDPHVSLEVVQLVVPDHVLRVPHDLQYHHVATVGEHKRLFVSQGGIETRVQPERVSAHELVFREAFRHALKMVFVDELPQHRGLHAHKGPPDVRRPHVQSFEFPKIGHMVEKLFMGHIEERRDETFLERGQTAGFQECHGAYLRSNRRDQCLKSFEGYHVTLERANGKVVWGVMELEATGLELRYRDSVQDSNHVESSYLLYGDEFQDVQAIFRFVDDLSPADRERRQKDLERHFHPGPVIRSIRATQHFFTLANDSLSEVLGLIMGRLRKPAGRYITDASDDYLKRFSTEVVGSVGSTYDPLLERLIGKKIVVELIENDESHEHVGILKNYSPDFYELLDVQYPQRQSLALAENGEVAAKHLKVVTADGVVRVTNTTTQPLLLQSMQIGEQEELLNVVVDGEETVELHPEETGQPASMTVKVVRELDMVVPRRRCIVRHRAERYEPTVIPEIIFDIGVMLPRHLRGGWARGASAEPVG